MNYVIWWHLALAKWQMQYYSTMQ